MTGAPVPLNWKGPLEEWRLLKYSVPGDGHCFFHALCAAFFEPYYLGRLPDGRPISPSILVSTLRRQIGDYLQMPVPTRDGNSNRTVYDTLGRGQYAEFSSSVPEYSLENMLKTL